MERHTKVFGKSEVKMPEKINLPTIDVVVATYNRPKSILNLLRSLSEQVCYDPEDLSVYVVDDRSSILYPVLEGRYPFHLKYIKREGEKKGPAVYSAWNLGVRAGKGEVIMRIDDDCVLSPFSLYITAVFHLFKQRLITFPYWDLKEVPIFHVENHCNVWAPCTPGKAFRRSWAEKIGGYDENFDGSMGFADAEFIFRLLRECDIKDCWALPGVFLDCIPDPSEKVSYRDEVIRDWRVDHPGELDPNYSYLLKKWPNWKELNG